jgi:hypothetical protein
LEDYRKLFMTFSLLAILLLSSPLIPEGFSQATTAGTSKWTDKYAVMEVNSALDNWTLVVLASPSERTVVYNFPHDACECIFRIDSSGNYIVAEIHDGILSKITPNGVRTVIYDFAADKGRGAQPNAEGFTITDVRIDSAGNYIVTEYDAGKVSKITPDGVRTVIGSISYPNAFAIDSSGNYIITRTLWPSVNALSKMTPDGKVSTIYNFTRGSWPSWVEIDSSGNYIVTEAYGEALSKVTPAGVRTVIYNFNLLPREAKPYSVDIDPSGNYIVSEIGSAKLSEITPDGVRTVLYSFSGVSPGTSRVIPSTSTAVSPDFTLYAAAVVGVVAVVVLVAVAALVLRRRR